MSFKCSVFGHAFGDSEIEREREEEGSEVVTTIRERQTCKRCGETRIVSENKEVTTLETAADIVADELEEDATGGQGERTAEPPAEETAPDETEPEGGPAREPGDATIVDAETGEQTDVDSGGSVESAVEDVDPATDDGVILEDEEEEEDTGRAPGEWPEEPDDGDDEWEPETEIDPTPNDDRSVEPTGSAVTVPEGEFRCPECGFTTPVEASSLRRGDFCPECHRGALEHATE